jgi:hypothetical protein
MQSTRADLRLALITASPRLGAVAERRDRFLKRVATGVTVLTGVIAVLAVAAAAVAFALG